MTPESASAAERRFVRWTDEARSDPTLRAAVDGFQPVDRPAGEAVARWLREVSLVQPVSATTYLLLLGERLAGFYALAPSRVELRPAHRRRLGDHLLPTVPAYLIAQLGRSAWAPGGTGENLVLHAIGTARRASEIAAAVVLVADPFDEATVGVWRSWGFRSSQTRGPHGLPRMWVPLG